MIAQNRFLKNNMMRYKTYLIFGAPGSGKGTQGKTLGSIPRFFHCACGDVFRSIDTRTAIGQSFLEYSSKGQLVPDEVTISLWTMQIQKSVSNNIFKPDIDSLVLDGIPRNVHQAQMMTDLIDVQRVFNLECPGRDELVRRLKKRALKDNRLDDANESVIKKRLDTFESECRPLIEYYGPEKVTTIDATQTPVQVLSIILAAILAES